MRQSDKNAHQCYPNKNTSKPSSSRLEAGKNVVRKCSFRKYSTFSHELDIKLGLSVLVGHSFLKILDLDHLHLIGYLGLEAVPHFQVILAQQWLTFEFG